MARAASRTSGSSPETVEPPAAPQPRWRRLPADARKSEILAAARKAFSESGDMNGTTIRDIADRAGVSEGLLYRHFDSKEQIFIAAVVEPLRDVVDKLVAAAAAVDRDEPLTPNRQVETLNGLYAELISTLNEVLPLLGLVLFGDPKIARKFYRQHFGPAMDRLAAAWESVEGRYGYQVESADISARAVMGMALLLALETRHNPKFDRRRAVGLITEGTMHGFFPALEPPKRGR